MTPENVVRDLLDSLAAADAERAIGLLDDEVVWRNTLLPELRGPRVAETLRRLVDRGIGFAVVWHHVASDGDVVLTDRTDVLSYGPWTSEFWCRGTFEVRDDKVVLWDDAFSWLDVVGSGVLGMVRKALPR